MVRILDDQASSKNSFNGRVEPGGKTGYMMVHNIRHMSRKRRSTQMKTGAGVSKSAGSPVLPSVFGSPEAEDLAEYTPSSTVYVDRDDQNLSAPSGPSATDHRVRRVRPTAWPNGSLGSWWTAEFHGWRGGWWTGDCVIRIVFSGSDN